MNGFDAAILSWFNQFAGRSELLDFGVGSLDLNVLKGVPFVLALVALWAAGGPGRQRRREVVVATVLAGLCAIAVGRGLASLLPFRPRPMVRADFAFVPPLGSTSDGLRTWSAFPSDHAMFFAALATGFWLVSPVLGAASHLYALVVIMLPRIYLGKHHPTDILAGTALGVAFALAANRRLWRERVARAPLRWSEARPALFFTASFLLAFQLATMFDDAKALLGAGKTAVRIVRHQPAPAELASPRGAEPGPLPTDGQSWPPAVGALTRPR